MARLGIEPGTPTSLVCVPYHWAIQDNINGPSSPNYHIPPPYLVFALKDTHDKHKLTLLGLIRYKYLNKEGHNNQMY